MSGPLAARIPSRALWLPAVCGLALYAAMMVASVTAPGSGDFGTWVYNHYFLSLLEGRFDVPARVITVEGHYTPDGTAFVYHGLAPVLTRALAWPFVDLTQTPLSAVTVLGFAALGSGAIQVAVQRILVALGPAPAPLSEPSSLSAQVVLLGGFMAWAASPGLLLASNASLYHEPIAFAYAATCLWMWLAAEVVVLRCPLRPRLLPMALVAGLAVHARPHLAVGLYLGMAVLGLMRLRAEQLVRRPLLPLAAAAVMLACGLALFAVNAARFGDPLRLFGGSGTELLWGFYFWEVYTEDTVRVAQAAADQASFHLGRIPANAAVYLADLPRGLSPVDLGPLHRAWTAQTGWVGLETPRIGLLFLAAPWALLIALYAWRAPVACGVLALAALPGALAMLAFTTVALRYRADLWPLVLALALPALGALARSLARRPARASLVRTAAVLGLLVSLGIQSMVLPYRIPVSPGLSDWDRDTCLSRSTGIGLTAAAAERICARP